MTIIQTVSPHQASGKVAQIYTQIEQRFGRIHNGFQMYSASPDLMEQLAQQNAYYLQHPTLNFALLAMIRMLVSEQNNCTYCIGFNEALLIEHCDLSPEQLAATRRDPASAPLNEKDKAMLLFVLKGTKDPKSIGSAHLDALRNFGWTDRDIIDGLFHGARNSAVDIMFDAFKVENDF
jgi:alkylhydroperoxidase family enzyme